MNTSLAKLGFTLYQRGRRYRLSTLGLSAQYTWR